MRVTSHGLRVGPNAEFSVEEPIANSSRFVLPRIGMPAARSLLVRVASYGATQPSRIFDAQVVGMSVVVKMSFNAIGTPASAEAGSFPPASELSTAAAASRACSPATCRKAWYSVSTAAMRSRCACVTSTEDTSREWILPASSAASSVVRSVIRPLQGSAEPQSDPVRLRVLRTMPARGSTRARSRRGASRW